MGKSAFGNAAPCLALILMACEAEPQAPVQAELKYYRATYSRYDLPCFIGDEYFAEISHDPESEDNWEIVIRRTREPGEVYRRIGPEEDSDGKNRWVSGFSTYRNRLYIPGKGKQPAIFDPERDEIVELHDESPYLDDHVIRNYEALYRIPLNHVYYYDLYGDAGMAYRRGERVALPEGLKLGYIKPEKFAEYSAFEQLFQEFTEGGGIDYTDFFGYDDKLRTWLFIHKKKPAFIYGSQNRDGSWEGREIAVSDPKNRNVLASFYVAFENYLWKFLSPQHFIGPYSPYLEGDSLSLDILDTQGRVHETGCVAVDDFDVSPNGRHVVAYGTYRDKAGEESSGLLLFEITYRALISQKDTVLRDRGSIEGAPLKRLRKGQQCTVLEHSEFRDDVDGVRDCWYKIRLPNKKEGWVFGAKLAFE